MGTIHFTTRSLCHTCTTTTSCIILNKKRKELTSSYLRNPEKLNNIIARSLTINKSTESLNILQSSINVSGEIGSFFSVGFTAIRLDASKTDDTKVFVVGSGSPFISCAHFIFNSFFYKPLKFNSKKVVTHRISSKGDAS
jgi:hypothetical protein